MKPVRPAIVASMVFAVLPLIGCGLKVDAGPDKAVVNGDPVVLEGSATGGSSPYTYVWSPATGLDNSAVAQPRAIPCVTTEYNLTATDSGGNTQSDTVTVTVSNPLRAFAGGSCCIAEW